MAMLRDTKIKVRLGIGIEDVTIWEGVPPEEPIIVAARISASEITLFVGPEKVEEVIDP